MRTQEMHDSLHCIVKTLQRTIEERYKEEDLAAEQISDKERFEKMKIYLQTRREEEEKAITDFRDLCMRYLFNGHMG